MPGCDLMVAWVAIFAIAIAMRNLDARDDGTTPPADDG